MKANLFGNTSAGRNRRAIHNLRFGLLAAGFASVMALGACGGGGEMAPPHGDEQASQAPTESHSSETFSSANMDAASSFQRK